MSDLVIALLLGGTLGAGLWSIVAALPRFAAPRLIDRVAPYVRDVTDPAGRTMRLRPVFDPASGIAAGTRLVWTALRGRLSALIGGVDVLDRRLERAGWSLGAEGYRGRQFAAALIGATIGAVLGAIVAARGASGAIVVALPVALALMAWVGCDLMLSRAIAARRVRIEEELPTVLDFLALCLSAGESLADAVRRTGEVGSGVLAAELRRAAHAAATGTPFAAALAMTSARIGVPAFARAVDQITAALDRGAPIAAVLRDQASDAHEEDRRRLLESAGKKEVTMLLPLVFLILPLSVLMAAYPGFVMLQQGFR